MEFNQSNCWIIASKTAQTIIPDNTRIYFQARKNAIISKLKYIPDKMMTVRTMKSRNQMLVLGQLVHVFQPFQVRI